MVALPGLTLCALLRSRTERAAADPVGECIESARYHHRPPVMWQKFSDLAIALHGSRVRTDRLRPQEEQAEREIARLRDEQATTVAAARQLETGLTERGADADGKTQATRGSAGQEAIRVSIVVEPTLDQSLDHGVDTGEAPEHLVRCSAARIGAAVNAMAFTRRVFHDG